MKIVIVSDLHANLAAVEALPESHYDQLWCIGDLVDYGPRPQEVVRWVQHSANAAVRGNHDHAVGYDVDPQCSPPFRRLAAETRRFTRAVCSPEEISFLRDLPIQREIYAAGTRFYLVHAMPTDPLFGYCPEKSEQWKEEVAWVGADVLVVGHTHTPFVRKVGQTVIVNPGSLGQPKTGRPDACYAVWEDGKIYLKEYRYPIMKTITQILEMPISPDDQEGLIAALESGSPTIQPKVTPSK